MLLGQSPDQAGLVDGSQQQQQHHEQHAKSTEPLPGSKQWIERPSTPQQCLQHVFRAGTGALSPLSPLSVCGCDSDCEAEEQVWEDEVKSWAVLPEAVFADMMSRVSGNDVG
jgi:hypothetical protein